MSHTKMDWLRMETRMREAFDNLRKDCNGNYDALTRNNLSATMLALADILGNETGRGFPLDWADNPCPDCGEGSGFHKISCPGAANGRGPVQS